MDTVHAETQGKALIMNSVTQLKDLAVLYPAANHELCHTTEGKALIASECCSCMTMRGENHYNKSVERPTPSNFNADCTVLVCRYTMDSAINPRALP
jgi:hypothetical protein